MSRPVPNEFPSADPGAIRLAIVGESAGADEVAMGRPFCGKSGWLLNQWLASAGISRSCCFMGNVVQVKPSPSSNDFDIFEWHEARVQEGIAALREDLARFRPHCVVALGNAALHLFRHGNAGPGKSRLGYFQWQSHVGTWRGSLLRASASFDPFEASDLVMCGHRPLREPGTWRTQGSYRGGMPPSGCPDNAAASAVTLASSNLASPANFTLPAPPVLLPATSSPPCADSPHPPSARATELRAGGASLPRAPLGEEPARASSGDSPSTLPAVPAPADTELLPPPSGDLWACGQVRESARTQSLDHISRCQGSSGRGTLAAAGSFSPGNPIASTARERGERQVPGEFATYKFLPTWHPANTFREPANTFPLVSDLKRAVAEARSPELILPRRDIQWGLSIDELEARCAAIRAARTPVGFDIEGGLGGLQCCSFATSPSSAFVVDLMGEYFDRPRTMAAIASVLEDASIPKVLWNAAYERAVMECVASITLRNYEDPMIAWWERFSELPKGLDFVASILTREPYWAEGIGWDRKTGQPKVTGPPFWQYNGIDSAVTLEIWQNPLIRSVVESRTSVAFEL